MWFAHVCLNFHLSVWICLGYNDDTDNGKQTNLPYTRFSIPNLYLSNELSSLVIELVNVLRHLPSLNFFRPDSDWMIWASVSGFPIRTPVESNQWLKNWYLSLSSQVLGIIRIWQGLVGWVGYQIIVLVVWSPSKGLHSKIATTRLHPVIWL